MAQNNQNQHAKILMAANRLKRQIDRSGIPCPPLANMATPTHAQIGDLKTLLNQCMAMGDEIGEAAESLWDLLGLSKQEGESAHAPAPAPSSTELTQTATALAKAQATAPKPKEPPPNPAQPAKKKGFFGWLSPEAPSESKDDDEDKNDDSHYKGGLR